MKTKFTLQMMMLVVTSIILSSCYSYGTTVSYSNDLRVGYSTSEPIHLSLKDNTKSTIYFVLCHKLNTDQYEIKVRWISYSRTKHFDGNNSTLKFLVDNVQVMSFEPAKYIKTVAIHMDPSGVEEEGVYYLNRKELERIANAKSIVVDLQGKYENKVGVFNKMHTFKAFKDFLKNS